MDIKRPTWTSTDLQMTITAANGASGVTLYGWVPSTLGSIDNPICGSGKNNFGVFELNPLTTDTTRQSFECNGRIRERNPEDRVFCSRREYHLLRHSSGRGFRPTLQLLDVRRSHGWRRFGRSSQVSGHREWKPAVWRRSHLAPAIYAS